MFANLCFACPKNFDGTLSRSSSPVGTLISFLVFARGASGTSHGVETRASFVRGAPMFFLKGSSIWELKTSPRT